MRDMTTGSPYGHLWRYALPLLLGNWLQLAYNAVDSIIAGRFIGQNALAAEGIAAPVMNLVILAISGMCIGSGVLMSEHFGAGNHERLKRTMSTMLLFGAAVCLVVAGAGFILAPQILRFLEAPGEIFEITVVYLRITFLGAPFTFFYNAIAAGMKSVGDSRTPLKFLMFSAILNAVLDLIFLGLLGFGILCSAVTTVV
ncbi:MAG TPA: MATE family efflux transporter, partial [Lachnospiraceae bacterium]|nr:MATE family efflux transporter [Lachnospiraceae bacterium]